MEKKEHTLKNTVMSLPDKFIVFLGRTFSGHNHDYSMLKQEFPPDGDWFSDIHVRVDLGYQGMQSDYNIDQIDIPHKKPRKSKKNPTPELSARVSKTTILGPNSLTGFWIQHVKAVSLMPGGPALSGK